MSLHGDDEHEENEEDEADSVHGVGDARFNRAADDALNKDERSRPPSRIAKMGMRLMSARLMEIIAIMERRYPSPCTDAGTDDAGMPTGPAICDKVSERDYAVEKMPVSAVNFVAQVICAFYHCGAERGGTTPTVTTSTPSA